MHVTFANKYMRSSHNNPIVMHSYRFDVCFFTMNNHTLFNSCLQKSCKQRKVRLSQGILVFFFRKEGAPRPLHQSDAYGHLVCTDLRHQQPAPGILLLGFLVTDHTRGPLYIVEVFYHYKRTIFFLIRFSAA